MKRIKQPRDCWWRPVRLRDRLALPLRRHGIGQSAFSLIDLLVVVAVIVLLAALFLPALSKAKHRGWTTVCLSNLRQIGTAMRAFAGDHGDSYPESGGDIHWNAVDPWTGNASWTGQIVKYMRGANPLDCPGNAQLPRASQGPFNYFNGCRAAFVLAGTYAPLKADSIAFPGLFVLGGDTAGTMANSAGLKFDPLDADKNDGTMNCIGGAAGSAITASWRIHEGGQNVLFADGHSDWYAGYKPEDMTFACNIVTNWGAAR